jgi:hypothetical protein
MRLLGLLLLTAGWAITLAAVVLLTPMLQKSLFVVAGLGVEALGLALLIRAHQPPKGDSA